MGGAPWGSPALIQGYSASYVVRSVVGLSPVSNVFTFYRKFMQKYETIISSIKTNILNVG